MVASLADRGHEIHVVFRGPGSIPCATYESFAIPDIGLKYPFRWRKRQYKYLSAFLRDFDIVSIQFLHSWGFTPEIMDKGCFTVRPWGSDICPPPDGPQPLPETIERRKAMLRNAHAVAVTCGYFRKTVAEYAGIDTSRIKITPLGVDTNRFTPGKKRADRPVVGYFKGFGHAYGTINLVRAMPRIVSAFPEVLFEMVGEGPTLDTCRQEAVSLGVDKNVRWINKVPYSEIPRIIQPWWISVIPSVRESFGISALESAAMEIPVVASRVGGLCETVSHGNTGIHIPPENSDAIAEAVIDLLGDEDKRTTFGRAGREFVKERFEWRDCVTRWEDFYLNAVASRNSCVV